MLNTYIYIVLSFFIFLQSATGQIDDCKAINHKLLHSNDQFINNLIDSNNDSLQGKCIECLLLNKKDTSLNSFWEFFKLSEDELAKYSYDVISDYTTTNRFKSLFLISVIFNKKLNFCSSASISYQDSLLKRKTRDVELKRINGKTIFIVSQSKIVEECYVEYEKWYNKLLNNSIADMRESNDFPLKNIKYEWIGGNKYKCNPNNSGLEVLRKSLEGVHDEEE